MPLTSRAGRVGASLMVGGKAMADKAENGGRRRVSRWRIVPWAVAALLLLLPAVAMRFGDEVTWTASDFIFMGVMLFGACGVFELAARMSGNNAYRAAVAIAVVATVLLIWINLAVGIIGSENNPANQMFFGVIVIGLIGAFLARFEAEGMARALAVTGIAQALTAVAAMVMGHFTWILVGFFCALWFGSASLFRKAARDQQ